MDEGLKKCKKCGIELPQDYRHKKCNNCRNNLARKIRNLLFAGAAVGGGYVAYKSIKSPESEEDEVNQGEEA